MRTSNKILLGAFIATILIITGIHAVLFAKIKSGNLVNFTETNPAERIMLSNIKHVSIKGFEEFIVLVGDTAELSVGRNSVKDFNYRVAGDSLIIEAGFSDMDYEAGRRKYMPVTLRLPPVESITANFSTVFLRGAKDSTRAISGSLHLNRSELNISAATREPEPVYWKSLQVHALNSRTVFFEGATIKELFVNLDKQSSLTDAGANLQNFSLQLDSTSSVNLRKNSLNNIKIIK